MRLGLAQKLILLLTTLVVAVGVVAGTVSVRAQERYLLHSIVLGADQLSRGIASATWHAMRDDNRDSAYEIMRTIARQQGIERIRLFNREGRVMFTTQPGERTNVVVDKRSETCAICHSSQAPKLLVSPSSRVRVLRTAQGGRLLTMVTPFYNEPSCSQAACHAHPANVKVLGVLDVSLSLAEMDQQLAGASWRVLIIFGSQILLISAFIFVFMRRFLERPVRRLISATRSLGEMNLDEPIRVDGQDELSELAHSFNAMRERLQSALGEINDFTHSLESRVQRRTEQLQAAQKKLVQNDRMASLGQLAASVAHEINNPISGVLNLSMLMQRILKDDGIPPGRIEEFRKYLGQVASETSRVGRIVSDLLSFSRRSKPQRSQADLNAIVNTTVSLVGHKLRLSNVQVDLDLAARLPGVLCDPSQMQQVVLNLLLNAAEATHGKDGARVEVRTSEDPANGAVQLAVSDNGEGIPPENIPRIFDPFFTTKADGKGVGLGLAVLYGIVQAHGGDVNVVSQVGQGTTFTVTLPVQLQTAGTP